MFRLYVSIFLLIGYGAATVNASTMSLDRQKIYGIHVGESLRSLKKRCWFKNIPVKMNKKLSFHQTKVWDLMGALNDDRDVKITRLFLVRGKIFKIMILYKKTTRGDYQRKVEDLKSEFAFSYKRLECYELLKFFARINMEGRDFEVETIYYPEKDHAFTTFFDLSLKRHVGYDFSAFNRF